MSIYRSERSSGEAFLITATILRINLKAFQESTKALDDPQKKQQIAYLPSYVQKNKILRKEFGCIGKIFVYPFEHSNVYRRNGVLSFVILDEDKQDEKDDIRTCRVSLDIAEILGIDHKYLEVHSLSSLQEGSETFKGLKTRLDNFMKYCIAVEDFSLEESADKKLQTLSEYLEPQEKKRLNLVKGLALEKKNTSESSTIYCSPYSSAKCDLQSNSDIHHKLVENNEKNLRIREEILEKLRSVSRVDLEKALIKAIEHLPEDKVNLVFDTIKNQGSIF